MQEFLSEDDLKTFEGWLRYQAVDATTLSSDDLAMWRGFFDEGRERSLASPKVGLMKLQPAPGQHLYGVAVREGSDLQLTLWIRRSKNECFVMIPCNDPDWGPHNSYHRDGRFHMKSYRHKLGSPQQRQVLTGTFQGTEHLGAFMGHSPKYVGAVCDPAVFSGVVEVAPGILGPRNGGVIVDLVAPGCEPLAVPNTIIQEEVFRDTLPWIMIRIFS